MPRRQIADADLAFRRHTGRDALSALEETLRDGGMLPVSSLYMDPAYLAAGHEGERPEAIVAYDGDLPVAYAPFIVRPARQTIRIGPRSSISLPYRQLCLFGCDVGPESPLGAAGLVVDRVVAEAADYHRGVASETAVDGPFALAMLALEARRRRRPSVTCKLFESYRVRIEGTFEDFLKTRFTSKSRNGLSRKVRRFEKTFAVVEAQTFTQEGAVQEFLSDAETVARRSYQWNRGLPVVRASDAATARLQHLARRNQWRAYILYAEGRPCAYCQGSIHRGVFDYDVPGYDGRYAAESPGAVLLYRILEDLFADHAAQELDFGAGPAEYKRQFATHKAGVLYASIYPARAYAWALRNSLSASDAFVTTVKAIVRRVKSSEGNGAP